jgi:hypothetical protein
MLSVLDMSEVVEQRQYLPTAVRRGKWELEGMARNQDWASQILAGVVPCTSGHEFEI